MKKAKRLKPTETERRIDQAWREMLKENGLVWSSGEIRKVLKEVNLSPEVRFARGLTVGMALGLSSIGKGLARKVKTQGHLEKVLQQIKRMGYEMPTMIRKATKQMVRTLPRRGGPGRQRKLNLRDAAQVCDQIALFIRRKHTLKQALQKVADLTPTLLGKKVGSRTLQKAWDRRDEFAPE